jgi:hypothetical protein
MTDDRIPYDTGALEDYLGVAAVGLAQWETRDDTRAQSHIRHAANDAMDAIDTMLRELHQMRSRLVNEMRDSDDATAARVDRLLAGPALVCPGCGSPEVDLARGPSGITEAEDRRTTMTDGEYPEDWEEQGWCCRECAVMAWRETRYGEVIGCSPPEPAYPRPEFFDCP